MSARRSGAGVGVLDGILYAVGGHDGPLVRKTVEAFNPDTNQWTTVSDMAHCRRNAGKQLVFLRHVLTSYLCLCLMLRQMHLGVVALNGLLYVVGGDDGSCSLASVEVYCPRTDTWTTLPTCMGVGRSYAGVAIIDKPMGSATTM